MDKKHILFILDHFSPYVWGAEILFENLTKRLAQQEYTITILTTHHDSKIPKHEIFDDGRIIYRTAKNRYFFIVQSIYLAIKLAKNADIIHTTTYSSAFAAWCAGKIRHKPVVITVHEVFHNLWYRFMGWRGFFYKMFECFVFLFGFDAYICVSHYTRNSLRLLYWISDDALFTIYNGIDETLFSRSQISKELQKTYQEYLNTKNHKTVLFYGRPGVSKWLEYLIRGIKGVAEKYPDIKYILILGNEPADRKKQILKMIEDWWISPYIHILPPQSWEHLRTYISIVDLCVIPSLAEGFGFAAAEICSLGTPLLVTNAGALPEVVSGKYKIINAGNSNAIMEGIIEFFENGYPEMPKKSFSWEKTLTETKKLYDSLV